MSFGETESEDTKLSFFEALAGIVLEPSATMEALFSKERPPYYFTFALILVLTIFVPIIAQIYKYQVELYNVSVIYSLVIVLFLTLFLFLLIESIFLLLLGIDFTPAGLFAAVAYSLTPLTFSLWLIYLFNYLSSGKLTVVTLLLTGFSAGDDSFIKILPIAAVVVQLMILIVFYYALRAMGGLGGVTAFMVSMLSLIPLYSALLLSLMVAELVREGTIAIFLKLLASPDIVEFFQR